MDKRNTIVRILNELEKNIPIVEAGDIIETNKTLYPRKKPRANITINEQTFTPPLASSKETKSLLKKDKSVMVEIFKDFDRGDILIVKDVKPNKILVENLSIKEEHRGSFEIEKLDLVKGSFTVVKRKSIDLVKTLNKLMGE